jgi:hypothetical protein
MRTSVVARAGCRVALRHAGLRRTGTGGCARWLSPSLKLYGMWRPRDTQVLEILPAPEGGQPTVRVLRSDLSGLSSVDEDAMNTGSVL